MHTKTRRHTRAHAHTHTHTARNFTVKHTCNLTAITLTYRHHTHAKTEERAPQGRRMNGAIFFLRLCPVKALHNAWRQTTTTAQPARVASIWGERTLPQSQSHTLRRFHISIIFTSLFFFTPTRMGNINT